MTEARFYRLAAGVDVVRLGDDSMLFRSPTLSIKLDGSMADVLGRRVLPLLREPRVLSDLQSTLVDIPADELEAALDSLVDARVLERSPVPRTVGLTHPFSAFVRELGVDQDAALERLRAARIAIFGLEAHGAHLALDLARIGVGTCILADAFPVLESDALLMPASTYRKGLSRQQAVAEAIQEQSPNTSVTLAGELSRASVQSLAEHATLLVGCFDRGYEAAQHWINRAASATGVPALFAEIATHVATIGPCYLPGQSACYMCYRMRRIACDENYDEAMAYERFLNERRQPSLSLRATAPFLPAYVGSVLFAETVKLVALMLPATLAGKILEYDALTLESRKHAILRQPACPACRDEKKRGASEPVASRSRGRFSNPAPG